MAKRALGSGHCKSVRALFELGSQNVKAAPGSHSCKCTFTGSIFLETCGLDASKLAAALPLGAHCFCAINTFLLTITRLFCLHRMFWIRQDAVQPPPLFPPKQIKARSFFIDLDKKVKYNLTIVITSCEQPVNSGPGGMLRSHLTGCPVEVSFHSMVEKCT